MFNRTEADGVIALTKQETHKPSKTLVTKINFVIYIIYSHASTTHGIFPHSHKLWNTHTYIDTFPFGANPKYIGHNIYDFSPV